MTISSKFTFKTAQLKLYVYSYHHHTCNHVIHWAHFEQHLLDEPHFSTRLQISNTFSKNGSEHAPDLSLAGDITVFQQLHHAANALSILNNEVCLQVKLSPHQLQERETENVPAESIFIEATSRFLIYILSRLCNARNECNLNCNELKIYFCLIQL